LFDNLAHFVFLKYLRLMKNHTIFSLADLIASLFAPLAFLSFATPASADPSAFLASPAVDRNLYRDGEVLRTEGHYGPAGAKGWSLVCDEIPRLKQRYCNIITSAGGIGGVAGSGAVSLILSSSDDGHPAALMYLPLGIKLADGVTISVVMPDGAPHRGNKASALAGAKMKLAIVTCDRRVCSTLWNLTREQLAALNSGGKIKIGYSWSFSQSSWSGISSVASAPVEAVVDGAGFADAVSASLK
jgi:invasion protein IalB